MEHLPMVAQWLLLVSVKGAVFVGVILLIQKLTRRIISSNARLSLWVVLAFCLLSPIGWELPFASGIPQLPPSLAASTPENSAGMSAPALAATPSLQDSWVHQGLVWFGAVWLMGVAVLLLLTLLQVRRFARLKADALPASAADCAHLDTQKAALGIIRDIPLRYSAKVAGPLILGLIKPAIILPHQGFGSLSDQQKKHVLLHELQHIKGRDILWSWLAYTITVLHWFNPLVWIAYRHVKADIEMACDARVIASLPQHGRYQYGLTLIEAAQLFPRQQTASFVALGILEKHNELKNRVLMITQNVQMSGKSLLALALLVCAMVLTAVAQPIKSPQGDSIRLADFAALAASHFQMPVSATPYDDALIRVTAAEVPQDYDQLLHALERNGFTAHLTDDAIQIVSMHDAVALADESAEQEVPMESLSMALYGEDGKPLTSPAITESPPY